jgi:integrase
MGPNPLTTACHGPQEPSGSRDLAADLGADAWLSTAADWGRLFRAMPASAEKAGRSRIVREADTAFRHDIWRPAVVAANLDGLRIHDLRHTAVALWIAAGASPKEVAARAGHTSVSFVLDRYGHLFPEADTTLRARLDELFRAATEHRRSTADSETETAPSA